MKITISHNISVIHCHQSKPNSLIRSKDTQQFDDNPGWSRALLEQLVQLGVAQLGDRSGALVALGVLLLASKDWILLCPGNVPQLLGDHRQGDQLAGIEYVELADL
jgi:hypothetical protein